MVARWIAAGVHAKDDVYDRVFVSFVNPCWLHGDDISSEDTYTDQPSPDPAPVPKAAGNSTCAKKIFSFMFKKLGVTDVDVDTCIKDFANSDLRFHDFASDVRHNISTRHRKPWAWHVSSGKLHHRLQSAGRPSDSGRIGGRRYIANISTGWFDKTVEVAIGASDVWEDIDSVAHAVEAKHFDSIGDSLNKLLND